MKMSIMLNAILICLVSMNTASAVNRYQAEIDIIKKNKAIYSEVAEKKLADIDDVIVAWRQIRNQTSELGRVVKLKVKSNSINQDESSKQLQEFSDEKVYVENVLLGISIIKPKIESLGKNLETQLNKIPEIKEENLKDLALVLSNINDLELEFKERKTKVDENLETFRLWQYEIAAEANATYKYAVMGHLEVVKSLGQIENILSLLSLKFSLALKHKNHAEAEKILHAYSWLKSAFPFYFSDKITTQSQYDYINQIINDADYEQHEMTTTLRIRSEKLLKPVQGVSNGK